MGGSTYDHGVDCGLAAARQLVVLGQLVHELSQTVHRAVSETLAALRGIHERFALVDQALGGEQDQRAEADRITLSQVLAFQGFLETKGILSSDDVRAIAKLQVRVLAHVDGQLQQIEQRLREQAREQQARDQEKKEKETGGGPSEEG